MADYRGLVDNFHGDANEEVLLREEDLIMTDPEGLISVSSWCTVPFPCFIKNDKNGRVTCAIPEFAPVAERVPCAIDEHFTQAL